MDVGDVIDLNVHLEQSLIVNVGGIPKFAAQPGKVGKKMAVQILDTLKGGDDEYVE